MDRDQQYLTTLLEKVPKWELTDPQHQEDFDRIKSSLSNTSDFQGRLKSLYRVANFSDFALGLMWILERVARDASKLESTLDEESFVLGLLKKAFGETAATTEVPEQPFGFDFPQPSSTETPLESAASESPTEQSATSEGVVTGATVPSEESFSATLEKLLEAVQSGSEERTILIDELTSQAEEIVAAQDSDNDYKTFCGYLVEFLKYVSANQLFDDIRVMNLISNVFDPFAQWAKTGASERSGFLEQPIEMLRDFKALFE